jgi:dephospho-CoA kinase
VTRVSSSGPVRIGLTGPIGCGKSTVADRLAARGALVIDGDRLARDVTAPGGAAFASIVERFGPAVLSADGSLDRAALGRRVFADPAELRELEAITHPLIRPRIVAALDAADASAAAAVVLEAIRLVEGGYVDLLDEVWLVTCRPEVQLERLATRGLDRTESDHRISAQVGLVDRVRPVADRILETSGRLDETLAAADRAFDAALDDHSGPAAG